LILTIGATFNCTRKKEEDTSSEETRKELLKRLDAFNTAFREANVSELTSMITETYLHVNGNSRSIGKKEWLNYLNKRKTDIKSGSLEVLFYRMDEVDIELFENTAFVSARIMVTNKRDTTVQESEYRVTSLWVNQAGSWKRAGFHDTKIK
jgi:hypothetical protein